MSIQAYKAGQLKVDSHHVTEFLRQIPPLRLPLQRVAGRLRGRRRGRPEGLGAHAFPRRHQPVERLSATARKTIGMGGERRPRGASARPRTPPGLRVAYLFLLYDALPVAGETGLEQSHFRGDPIWVHDNGRSF